MLRRIIIINEDKCNGCGACAAACHEGAIEMIGGKAKLTREDYCDGLGDCLPACPAGAISFEEREAPAYNEKAVLTAKMKMSVKAMPHSCPGAQAKTINHEHAPAKKTESIESCLKQWPVQIKLVSPGATYFNGAELLIAADCTAYAYGDFHRDFIKNRITLIGCPKLDDIDYSEKLTAIIKNNNIKSITVIRMEVPCCGGIEMAVKKALQNSQKIIPLKVITIRTNGSILE